ncbi:unnamed protein product [Allacma fusca]|uniref:Uncharacterized protein n=1 Tax=Allacma fusca TaxID=39272 RepID=A0A8J2KFU7_9HEXA|nr:unnamed protein product [Allacma fusca]
MPSAQPSGPHYPINSCRTWSVIDMPKKSFIIKRSGNPSLPASEVVSATTGHYREQASTTCRILSVDKLNPTGFQKDSVCSHEVSKRKESCEYESVSVGVEVRPKTRRKPTEQKKCSQNTTGTMAGRSYVVCCRCEPVSYRCPPPRPYKPTWDSSPRLNNCYRRPSAASMRTCPVCSCSSKRSIRHLPSDTSCQNLQPGGSTKTRNNCCDCNFNRCPCCNCLRGRKAPVECSNLKVQTSFSIFRISPVKKCNETPDNPLNSFLNMNDEDWNYCFGSNPEKAPVTVPNIVANKSGSITPDAPQLRCAQQLLLQAQKLLMGAADKLLAGSFNQGPELNTCEAELEALNRMSELVGNITQLPTFNKRTSNCSRSPSPNIKQVQLSLMNNDRIFQCPRSSGQENELGSPGWQCAQENNIIPQMNCMEEAPGAAFQKTPSATFEPVGASEDLSWARPNDCKPYSMRQGYSRASSPVRFPTILDDPQNSNCNNLYGQQGNFSLRTTIPEFSGNLSPLRSQPQPQQLLPMQSQGLDPAGFCDFPNYGAPQRRIDETIGLSFWRTSSRTTLQPQQRSSAEQTLEGPGQCNWGFNDNDPLSANIQQPQMSVDQGYWSSPRSSIPQQTQIPDVQRSMGNGYCADNFLVSAGMPQVQGLSDQNYGGCPLEINPQQGIPSGMPQTQDFIGQSYQPVMDTLRPLPNTQGQSYGYRSKDCTIQRVRNNKPQEQGLLNPRFWPSPYNNVAGPLSDNQAGYDYPNSIFQNRLSGLDQPDQSGQNSGVVANHKFTNQERIFPSPNSYSSSNPENNYSQRASPYQNDSLNQDYMYPNVQINAPHFQPQFTRQEQPITVIISNCNSAQDTCVPKSNAEQGNLGNRTNKSKNSLMNPANPNLAEPECSDGNSCPGSENPNIEDQYFESIVKTNTSVSWNLNQPQMQTQVPRLQPRKPILQPKMQLVQTKSQRQFGSPDMNQSSPNVQCNYYTSNFIASGGSNGNPGSACCSYSSDDSCSNKNETGVTGYSPCVDARKNRPAFRTPFPTRPCTKSTVPPRLCNSCGRSQTSCECNGVSNRRPPQVNCGAPVPCNPGNNEPCNRFGGQRKPYGRLARQDSISGLAGIIGVTPLTPNPLLQREMIERCI